MADVCNAAPRPNDGAADRRRSPADSQRSRTAVWERAVPKVIARLTVWLQPTTTSTVGGSKHYSGQPSRTPCLGWHLGSFRRNRHLQRAVRQRDRAGRRSRELDGATVPAICWPLQR